MAITPSVFMGSVLAGGLPRLAQKNTPGQEEQQLWHGASGSPHEAIRTKLERRRLAGGGGGGWKGGQHDWRRSHRRSPCTYGRRLLLQSCANQRRLLHQRRRPLRLVGLLHPLLRCMCPPLLRWRPCTSRRPPPPPMAIPDKHDGRRSHRGGSNGMGRGDSVGGGGRRAVGESSPELGRAAAAASSNPCSVTQEERGLKVFSLGKMAPRGLSQNCPELA